MNGMRGVTLSILGSGLALWGAQGLAAGDASSSVPLAGTEWRLVEFQSMDDRQGITRPGEGSLYTMWLHGDGTVAMQLNCNRATGTWSAAPGSLWRWMLFRMDGPPGQRCCRWQQSTGYAVWATGWTCPGRAGSIRKRRGRWAYR